MFGFISRKSKWRPWGVYFFYLFWVFLTVLFITKLNLKNFSVLFAEISELTFVSILVINYKKEFPGLIKLLSPALKYFLFAFLLALGISFLTEGFIPFLVCGNFCGDFTLNNFEKIFTSSFWSLKYATKMAMGVIVAPLVEETLFRGVLLNLFLSSYGLISSIILNGLIFGLPHIAPLPGFGYWSIIINLLHGWIFGILLSAITYKTKNLSFAFGFHISNNFLAFLTS
ncbi:MAG: CPBP family intramembrane metalloprotease [Acidobacteria bacterium]|nr:CPBP family intramembrane metalloprotease [Acidobacteriota bacterium]